MNNMDIEVHRAARTYYTHNTVLLNIPNRQLDSFFSLPEWYCVSAGKYLGLPEVGQRRLSEFGRSMSQPVQQTQGLSGADLDSLMNRQAAGEISPEQMLAELQRLRTQRAEEQQAASPSGIAQALVSKTGVSLASWADAGQELLEAILPLENARPVEYDGSALSDLGLRGLTLLNDFPILSATYAYSRAEYSPRRTAGDGACQCQLNPFPAEQQYGGRFPIYVDQVEADALLLSLDHRAVLRWLRENGIQPTLPPGSDQTLVEKAYFTELFKDVPLRETIGSDRAAARLVFGLLHTMSHLCIKQAALTCGLEATSLSEYLFPRALSFALYCNHRFGARIGALTALFEQSADTWLRAVRETRKCVYDPVCRQSTASCHACTHLSETSCRFFNLNLSRSFLFGGPDASVGQIPVGYFRSVIGR